MPNAPSSQKNYLPSVFAVVAGILINSCWIFPRREPCACLWFTPGDLSLDPIHDLHFSTIKSIADPGQAAAAQAEEGLQASSDKPT